MVLEKDLERLHNEIKMDKDDQTKTDKIGTD